MANGTLFYYVQLSDIFKDERYFSEEFSFTYIALVSDYDQTVYFFITLIKNLGDKEIGSCSAWWS